MSLESYAESELRRAGMFDKDGDYDGELGPAVMRLVKTFSNEGHSGMSAGIALAVFSKLAKWEPLSALTGEDDEWVEVGTGVFQNKRCSRVFKDGTRTYDIEGKVFREKTGACYTNKESSTDVVFPYTPTTVYVDREKT